MVHLADAKILGNFVLHKPQTVFNHKHLEQLKLIILRMICCDSIVNH